MMTWAIHHKKVIPNNDLLEVELPVPLTEVRDMRDPPESTPPKKPRRLRLLTGFEV